MPLPAGLVPVPARVGVVLAPGDDVFGARPDLLVAPRAAVFLRSCARLDQPNLPALGPGADDVGGAKRLRDLVGRRGSAAALGLRPVATRHYASIPPSITTIAPVV